MKTTKLFGIAAFAAAFMALGAVGAHAQLPLSFGVGASFVSDFGGGVSGRVSEANGSVAGRLGNEVYWHGYYAGLGHSIFLDARFAQLSFGYFSSGIAGSRSRPGYATASGHTGHPHTAGIEIGLLGKFPVELSPRITVFPLGGVAYRIILAGGNTVAQSINPIGQDHGLDANPLRASALWFRLGGGMDISFNERTFLRTSLTYGVRLRNRWENDVINGGPHHAGGDAGTHTTGPQTGQSWNERWYTTYDSARLGHGVDITVGIGFRLN